jgi:hypothetical protein
MERALRDVLAQAAGPLGGAGRTAVAVAFRQLAHRIQVLAAEVGPSGGAGRTSGGQPSVVFYVEHPLAESAREWLCVDLRSEAHRDSWWRLRLGVEVEPKITDGVVHTAAVSAAQVRAHDLATAVRQTLLTSSFVVFLRDMGESQLADALMISRGDGLRQPPDQETGSQWRKAAEAGQLQRRGRKLEGHPLFFHDQGRRLSSISHLDYRTLTVGQLATLVTHALGYLREAAGKP